MIIAAEIMRRAATLLMDVDHVRWPLPEMADWIDEGVSTIILVKPSAGSATITVNLIAGTRQALPDDQRIVMLLDLVRNVSGTGGAAGRMIKPVTRDSLDALEPRWHDPARVPFKKEVRQFVHDPTVPREYFVYPGNDGTGAVEAVVSQLPQSVTSLIGDANPEQISSWEVTTGLQDEYQASMLDYVMYRAFSKEDLAAAPARATMHYQAFAAAVGIQSQVEQANSPNRRR